MSLVSDYRSGSVGLQDLADTATPTFVAADIGTASTDRYVLVGINGRAATNRTISGVTIGGIAATAVGAQLDNAGNTSAWYIALVPTGTTADIVITLDAAWLRTQIGVWALTGLSGAIAFDRKTDTTFSSSVVSVSMSCLAGGDIYALANQINDSSMTNWGTWVALTERFDANIESQGRGAGASAHFAAAQSGLTVSATRGGGTGTTPTFLVIALSPLVSGSMAATETGGDTAVATGTVLVTGAMSSAETGSDTGTATGAVLVTGLLTAVEAGGDTVAASGSVLVFGALDAEETGSDTAAFVLINSVARRRATITREIAYAPTRAGNTQSLLLIHSNSQLPSADRSQTPVVVRTNSQSASIIRPANIQP